MNNLKDKLVYYSTYSNEEKINVIQNELEWLAHKGKLYLFNIYFAEKGMEEVYNLNEDTLTDIFEDSLTRYFENEYHADNFDNDDKYVYHKDGWWNTTSDLEEAFNFEEIAKFFFENWAEYEDDFEEHLLDDEVYDDEDEEEVAELKAQGLI